MKISLANKKNKKKLWESPSTSFNQSNLTLGNQASEKKNWTLNPVVSHLEYSVIELCVFNKSETKTFDMFGKKFSHLQKNKHTELRQQDLRCFKVHLRWGSFCFFYMAGPVSLHRHCFYCLHAWHSVADKSCLHIVPCPDDILEDGNEPTWLSKQPTASADLDLSVRHAEISCIIHLALQFGKELLRQDLSEPKSIYCIMMSKQAVYRGCVAAVLCFN